MTAKQMLSDRRYSSNGRGKSGTTSTSAYVRPSSAPSPTAARSERLIGKIESVVTDIDTNFFDPKSYMKGIDLEALGTKKGEYRDGMDKAEAKWLGLLEEIERG